MRSAGRCGGRSRVMNKKVCKRCNHVWISRVEHEPVRCPKCQSPYWSRERVIKSTLEVRES